MTAHSSQHLPRIIDRQAQKLSDQIDEDKLRRAARNVSESLLPILDRAATKIFGSPTGRADAVVSGTIFRSAIGYTTKALVQSVQGASSVRWLWTLRRIPDRVFDSHYATSNPYDRCLADVLTGSSQQTRVDARVVNSELCYPLDGTAITRTLRLIMGAKFLSDLQSDYRWAGKGASFTFKVGRRPELVADRQLRESVRLYDERVASAGGGAPLSRMGTPIGSADLDSSDWAPLWITRTSGFDFPVSIGPPGGRQQDTDALDGITCARYVPTLLDSVKIEALAADLASNGLQLINKDVASLLFILRAASVVIARHRSGVLGLVRVGYILEPEERLLLHLRDTWEALPDPILDLTKSAGLVSFDEVVSALWNADGSPWPLKAGYPLRREGEVACLDVASASSRLDYLLESPILTGGAVHLRSQMFEESTQQVIDSSDWRPLDKLRALRLRQLRLNGRTITDIDAIGEKDKSLLVISCKSTPYTALADVGDHKTVRNQAANIESSVAEWQEIRATLRTNPVGDNYDFSEFDEIIGVVCTPQVVYTPAGPTHELIAPNLRAASSVRELSKWTGSDFDPVFGRRAE